MSEIQEFRDRCAKAIGWTFWTDGRNSCWSDEASGVLQCTCRLWNPDEDYNQAMMMRDRCAELHKGLKYIRTLEDNLERDCHAGVSANGSAFPTARQIAEAALKCLEQK